MSLLRKVPTLYTLLNGMVVALRSVIYTVALLLIILFIFAILVRTHVRVYSDVYSDVYPDLEQVYFPSCYMTFWALLMYGTFMDGVGEFFIGELMPTTSVTLQTLFLALVFITNFTVLNMLIGIITDVIFRAKQEQEEFSEQRYLRNNLLEIMSCYDKNGGGALEWDEYKLLMKNPEAVSCIRSFGTDVEGLKAILNMRFENIGYSEEGPGLPFPEIVSSVMRLRGEHTVKVTDFIEMRAYTSRRLDKIENILSQLCAGLLQKSLGSTQKLPSGGIGRAAL